MIFGFLRRSNHRAHEASYTQSLRLLCDRAIEQIEQRDATIKGLIESLEQSNTTNAELLAANRELREMVEQVAAQRDRMAKMAGLQDTTDEWLRRNDK